MDQGYSQVFWDACASGDFAAVCAEIKKGCDINYQNGDGRTALMRASFLGQERCVEVLLDAGADINAQDEAGRTALMEACVAFKKGVIRILLERGADVNLFDNNGCTARMRAAYGG